MSEWNDAIEAAAARVQRFTTEPRERMLFMDEISDAVLALRRPAHKPIWRCEGCGEDFPGPGDHMIVHKGNPRTCGPVSRSEPVEGDAKDESGSAAVEAGTESTGGVSATVIDSSRGEARAAEVDPAHLSASGGATPAREALAQALSRAAGDFSYIATQLHNGPLRTSVLNAEAQARAALAATPPRDAPGARLNDGVGTDGTEEGGA